MDIHTHMSNAVPLVWSSLRLAPIMAMNKEVNFAAFNIHISKAVVKCLSILHSNFLSITKNLLKTHLNDESVRTKST